MRIRKAVADDLNQIMDIYADARDFMVQTGNPRQWAAKNWPPQWLIERDIQQGKCHVCEDDQEMTAVFFYDYGTDIDPTYRIIENGNGRCNDCYRSYDGLSDWERGRIIHCYRCRWKGTGFL